MIIALGSGCQSQPEESETRRERTDVDWLYQVDSLLMPFWMSDAALGNPAGNFPNYRDRNGDVLTYENFDFKKVPDEFVPFLIGQSDSLRRNFIRVNSRQIYTYSAAYNLTGNEAFLARAKSGVDYLLEHGGYSSGSPYTYWQDGKGMPAKFQSNTQDLSYSLTGLSMYYYLTRDEAVLEHILNVKDFVISEYYDKSTLQEKTKLVMWVKDNFEADNVGDKHLLAVLDQLNAYLLFITPLVPDELSETYRNDVANLAYSLKDNFYDAPNNLFWGDLNNKIIGVQPTDFGHSIKSFWMLYLAGQLLNDTYLEDFAEKNAIELLKTAYIEDTGSWAEMYSDSTLNIAKNKVWWSFAELDQMAATLSFADTALYTIYLKNTYRYWQENMIDHENKETHLLLDESGNPIDTGLKKLHWKNGFHSLEHALIGFLSTSSYYGDETPLYFAFKKDTKPVRSKVKPYYYNGDIITYEESEFSDAVFSDFQKTRVIFQNIH